MTLLFDQNLSPSLPARLADLYRDSLHVSHLDMSSADDATIWNYAKNNGLAIVSKDSDFAERAVLENSPPKVIWIRLGNCSTSQIEQQLRTGKDIVRIFLNAHQETCLILGRNQ